MKEKPPRHNYYTIMASEITEEECPDFKNQKFIPITEEEFIEFKKILKSKKAIDENLNRIDGKIKEVNDKTFTYEQF